MSAVYALASRELDLLSNRMFDLAMILKGEDNAAAILTRQASFIAFFRSANRLGVVASAAGRAEAIDVEIDLTMTASSALQGRIRSLADGVHRHQRCAC
jgi:hypothetical protein